MPRHFRYLAPVMDLMPYPHEAHLRELLDEATGGTLVDLGGGTARVSGRLLEAFRRVVVMDVEPAMLRRTPGGVHRVRGRAEHLPLRHRSVDAVLMTDALHHFPDQLGALAEAHRVLRPGGILLLEEFDPDHWQGKLIRWGERLLAMGSRFRPVSAWERMLHEVGFPEVEVHRFSGRDVGFRAVREA